MTFQVWMVHTCAPSSMEFYADLHYGAQLMSKHNILGAGSIQKKVIGLLESGF